ncbi:MAG: hypothetical protein REI11_12490, partial [Patulibacter sp.]|nr:hypothetical protein [Patulibacter sp.]
KPAAAKAPAATAQAATPPAAAPSRPAARRPRIATPPEGRRADYSGTPATHRARKVTTNRPWLPSSGYSLPESKDRPPLGVALEGLAGALGDVARVSIGIVQSLSARRRGELESAPQTESERPEPTK